MKKTIALLLAVWGAASASAGVAYAVHRPASPASRLSLTPTSSSLTAPAPTPVAALVEDVVQMPVAVIVAHAARAVTRPPPPTRDLSDMRCSDWRALSQGSTALHVRYC